MKCWNNDDSLGKYYEYKQIKWNCDDGMIIIEIQIRIIIYIILLLAHINIIII